MEISGERAGLWAAMATSLLSVWKSFKSHGKEAQDARDARTMEMFQIHIIPRLDKIQDKVDTTHTLCVSMIPELASNIVRQTIDSNTTVVVAAVKEIIKVKGGS